jgi:hypothetical protein
LIAGVSHRQRIFSRPSRRFFAIVAIKSFCPTERVGKHPTSKHSPTIRILVMATVRLRIDVSGTVGDQAWKNLQQFDPIQKAAFGPQFGSSGPSKNAPGEPHAKGEWIGAEITLQTPLLAQYAVSHYLEQARVLDADVVD